MPMMALICCWFGYEMARPEISSCSLPKAIMLPENEIEPMITPSTIETISPRPMSALCWNSTNETSAAGATHAVEYSDHLRHGGHLDRACRVDRDHGPMARPTRINQRLFSPGMKSVATTAIAIPSAAIWLPRRAVAGELSSLRPTMKQTAAMRYATLIKRRGYREPSPLLASRPGALPCGGFSPKHLEHAVHEAAEDIG